MTEETIINGAVRKRKITKVILVVEDILTGTNATDGSAYKSFNNEDKVSLDLSVFTTETKQELKSKI